MSSLLRSTKFMRYFAGAARTLILNSAKTAEVNFLLNSKILTVSNNVFMRDYASSSKNESLEPLLQKLDSELRRYGRISKRDIDEVFDEIRRKNDITSSQSLLVIRCCGEMVPEELPEQRTQLVQKIWSVLTERGVPMDISHYNALLRVYIENEHPFSPAEFLNELENKGLQPNRVTYQRLMWRYCQEGDVEGATRVLEKMKELGFPVSEPVLNALVMGHAFHGDTDGARTVLETMASAGLQPTNKTYTLLACGFAKKGDLAGIEDILKIANERDALIGDKDILDIIEHLAIGGHADKVESLYKHLQKGIGYNQDVCNTIFRLINKGQEEVAKSILKTMPSTRAEDNMYKGAFFIKQILKVKNAPENTLKLCKELQEENLVPNAIFIATESALQQGLTELAGLLFKELKKEGIELRDHYYWPLLAKKARENDEEGLLQILRNMASEGLPVTSEALRDYVLPYLVKKDNPQTVITKLQLANVPAILAARNVMVELLSSGKIKEAADVAVLYRPFGQQQLVARPLLNALSKTQDIKSFATILHVITCRLAPADEQSADDAQSSVSVDRNEVGRIVKNAVKLTTDKTDKLLTALIEKGLGISTASAEAIEQYLGEKLTSSISEKLAKLTSPDIELAALRNTRTKSDLPQKNSVQLQGLLEQAKRKGNNVTRIQRQLLSALMLENEVEKVTNLLKELETENFELNSVTLAQIFEFYAQNGEIEKALHYKQYLAQKDPEFALSKYKLVQLALAMVNANRYNEAVQYLKDNKPNDDSTSFLLNTKCWQLLNALAEQKDAEKVKEITSILTENNYIEHSNVILGPSIKVHLLNDNIEGALAEFEYCCKQYRVTPWKGELMKTLILKEDASKLQWLSDLSTQIHGEVNVLHDLVLAFVECGRLRQARRILETPGMFAKQRRLEDACHRYEQEGKFEYIEGLLEATKELSHIDRSNIFYHLLVTYCKADETDKAVGLWTVLQEEGEVPSDQFLRHLGKHLKSKNRTVPFVIPQDERKQEKPEKKVAPPPQVSKKTITETIENMVKNGKAVQAMDLTIKHIKDGVTPRYPVIKYVLKTLAEVGNVDKVKELGSVATADLKKNLSYDSKLAQAIFANGDGENYIEDLYQKVQKAQSEQDIEDIIIKFPKNESLATIVQTGELLDRCLTIAEQIASKGNNMPINLLWVDFILAGKEKEADDIWNKYLVNSQLVAFRRLLQESYSRNEPQHIEKLIKCLKMNKNVTLSTIANAYSRLVELHMAQANLEDAKKSLEKGFAEGLTIDQINKSTVKRLKTAMEAVGQEFKY